MILLMNTILLPTMHTYKCGWRRRWRRGAKTWRTNQRAWSR